MDTIEVYAYVCHGIAGAPPDQLGMHVTHTAPEAFPAAIDVGDWPAQPRPVSAWKQQAYWALNIDGGAYPPVLIHIYFEGDLPGDAQRDEINYHAQRLAGTLLFKEN